MASKVANHGEVATQDDLEATDALAGACVHLVRHRRGTNLAFLEALRDRLVAGHEADRGGQRRRACTQLHQRGHHVEVERARVHLTHRVKDAVEAETFCDALLELRQLGLVATHEIQHVLRGTHRALDAAKWESIQQFLNPFDGHQDLIGSRGETLAQRGGLRRNIVGASSHDQELVLASAVAHRLEQRDCLVAGQFQRLAHLELLHIFGQVARGHPLVDLLVARQRIELLNACLHVVASDLLALRDRVQVDLVDDLLVVLDSALGDLDTEFLLGLEHCDPQLALKDDLVLRSPQGGHLRGGVTVAQNIGIIRFHVIYPREIAPSMAGRAMSLR